MCNQGKSCSIAIKPPHNGEGIVADADDLLHVILETAMCPCSKMRNGSFEKTGCRRTSATKTRSGVFEFLQTASSWYHSMMLTG